MLYKNRPVGAISPGGHIFTDFERLYQALYGELVTYFRRRLPNPNDAEDFTQRTFERLMRRTEVRTPENLLRVIAAGLLKDEYRDSARLTPDFEEREWPGVRDRTAALSMTLRNGDDEQEGPQLWRSPMSHLEQPQPYDFEDSDFAAEFDRAVRVLDPPLRDAFILGELRGLPSRESAEILGTSHVTANVRRENATTSIRKELTA